MPEQPKYIIEQEPIIVMHGTAKSASHFMADLEDCFEFEESITPLIDAFCEYKKQQGATKKHVNTYKCLREFYWVH